MTSYYSKKIFWRIIYRIWPPVLRLIEFLKIHNARQRYLLGYLSPDYNREQLIEFLLMQGFEFAYIAFKDPGEVLGMRRLDTPLYQYHIRLFKDGEIRGHYEYTPEARPVAHSIETGMQHRKDVFQKLLGQYLS